ncbi:MAG: serine/threonine protein kinase [Gemmataceae bacterium]|nr:serine/threonine protein kinase [Gemmataceae bacterium]
MENAVRPDAPSPNPAETPGAEVDLTGKTFGDFRILRRIGQGGMGQVYLAEQLSLKRNVALKIMRADMAANATAVARFQREAEAVARVTHANIVQVYAFGQSDGLHYMALEYVDGRNLREFIAKKGTPELLVALSILRQVASGLQRASELGIIHRDIKPENILLTRKGEVKVTDFGLSRCFGPEQQQPLNLTQSGVSMGTPLYMSPEQVQGKEVDPRTDIYSLGVTAYHLFTGQPPFKGQNGFEVAIQHVQNQPTPLKEVRPDLPIELCNIVHKMMAKLPEERYQTARELIRDLMIVREGLSGNTALRTQSFAMSEGTPALAPASSVRLSAAPPLAQPVPTRQWGLIALVVVSVVAAALGGALWRVGSESHSKTPPPVEGNGEAPLRLSASEAREAALREEVRRSVSVRDVDEYRAHVNSAIQLGALYLEQRRLKEADAYFKELRDKPTTPDYYLLRALGRVGEALVLAFADQAERSVLKFDEFQPPEKFRPADSRFMPPPAVLAKFPEYGLLFSLHLRPLVVEALNHNAANLAPKPLPDWLERLRRLPTPPAKAAASRTGQSGAVA